MTNILSQGFINRISLFSNLTKSEIDGLICYSKNKHYKKGQVVFLEEDEADNLFIILSGWVKVYNVSKDGNEAVVDIVGPNSFLNDIFLNQFQYNALAVEPANLLLIPLKKIKDLAKINIEFAFNLLISQSAKNKELTNQLAQLKLSDAKYKLGQFLLSRSFENGKKIHDIILKFDKAVIASYLGIKPETLSRVLQKLKEDGEIIINKNTITLTTQDSLCKYCNREIASACSHRNFDCY